jgi:hypothetical protein
MYNLVFIALITSLFTGCSSQSVLMSPTASLRFVGENVHVNVAGQNIDQRVLDQLMREIKGQLIIAGFDIETKDAKSINLKVQVTEFTPGNTALRMIISFGAGRGSLVYLAEYTSQEGKTLAKMNGEERFTGLEVGYNQNYGGTTTLGGEETATKVLIKEAAKHIVELALNPEQK